MRLTISGVTYVLEGRRGVHRRAGLDQDDYISGYRKMTDAV